ncbi:hypothetical protein [Cyanobium gracile]|uniref:hypothetical protein n=1 Tax=Cyanobium gracile TaxID=59930 RepID=UPI00031248FB|nr:hypothetical protein [Cyanobium gracile]
MPPAVPRPRVGRAHWQDQGEGRDSPAAMFENRERPAWVNWLILAIFLLSSWQLAGFWFQQLHH